MKLFALFAAAAFADTDLCNNDNKRSRDVLDHYASVSDIDGKDFTCPDIQTAQTLYADMTTVYYRYFIKNLKKKSENKNFFSLKLFFVKF